MSGFGPSIPASGVKGAGARAEVLGSRQFPAQIKRPAQDGRNGNTRYQGLPRRGAYRRLGPPLLYLHAEQYFEQVKPHLDALAKKWRVIAPRHPGYRAASAAPDFRSVDDLAYL